MEIFTLLETLEDILERSKKIEKNLQELSDENIKVKEVEKDEHIR